MSQPREVNRRDYAKYAGWSSIVAVAGSAVFPIVSGLAALLVRIDYVDS